MTIGIFNLYSWEKKRDRMDRNMKHGKMMMLFRKTKS